MAEAGALTGAHNFNGALAALDKALKKYPGESALIRLLAGTMTAKGAWERQQAVQTVLAKCQILRSQQRLAEAIEHVEAALQDYRAEPSLLSLLEQLEAEWSSSGATKRCARPRSRRRNCSSRINPKKRCDCSNRR